MSNKQIAALMAVRAFAGTNTVSADNNFADGVAAANRHVINHIDYLITQVQAGHEVPFVVEHESRFPFQGKMTSEPQLADRHALQAEGKHPAPCARFCEANAFQIEIRQLSAQLEQADRQRVPDGWKLVPAWKGYALMGTGNYVINHSADFDPELGAELIITLATDKDREGDRQIGESRPTKNPGDPIQADDMVIRIGFLNERGLFALEDQLAEIRKLHFAAPEAPAQAVVPAPWREFVAEVVASAESYERRTGQAVNAEWVKRGKELLAAAPEAPAQASAVDEREKELKWLCAEAYQVVASMLNDLGAMETEKANKILDNLSQARFVHDDVLPWPELAPANTRNSGDLAASAVDERAAFEEWYSQNAFNFERDPIGSRECGLQWKAWQARAALAQKGGK